jgi:hypothetical protein
MLKVAQFWTILSNFGCFLPGNKDSDPLIWDSNLLALPQNSQKDSNLRIPIRLTTTFVFYLLCRKWRLTEGGGSPLSFSQPAASDRSSKKIHLACDHYGDNQNAPKAAARTLYSPNGPPNQLFVSSRPR